MPSHFTLRMQFGRHQDAVWIRDRNLKPGQNGQTLVVPTGQVATVQACPLDANWRAYYDETLALCAADDFRLTFP